MTIYNSNVDKNIQKNNNLRTKDKCSKNFWYSLVLVNTNGEAIKQPLMNPFYRISKIIQNNFL